MVGTLRFAHPTTQEAGQGLHFYILRRNLWWLNNPILTLRNAKGAGFAFRRISMSLDSDVIVDRRRIRRKLTFWRVASVIIAIGAIAVIGMLASPGGRGTFTSSGSIARVKIDGLIRSDQDRVEALERLAKSQTAA